MSRLSLITTPDTKPASLPDQAACIRAQYPEIYAYLTERDRALVRALARIPSRADIELSSVFNARSYLDKTMRDLAPGIGDLCDSEACT